MFVYEIIPIFETGRFVVACYAFATGRPHIALPCGLAHILNGISVSAKSAGKKKAKHGNL